MQWTHTDSGGIAAAVVAARARARSRSWPVADSPRLLRALAIDTARAVALLEGSIVVSQSETAPPVYYMQMPAVMSVGERSEAVRVLVATFEHWAADIPRDRAQVETVDGETGIAWAGAAVAAVAILGGAAAIGYVGDRAMAVWDRYLRRSSSERELAAVHATTLGVVDRHVAREQVAGKPLPLDEASKQALAALSRAQSAIVERPADEPLGSSFPSGGAISSGVSVASLLVGAVGLFLMTRR